MEESDKNSLTHLRVRIAKFIILILAYLALALVFTYPLIFHFRDYFIGGSVDGSLTVWNFWWEKFALVDLGQGIFDCNYLFYPYGASLTFQSMPKLLSAAGIPLQSFLSLAAAYNVIVILTFVASGLTAYWLVFRLTRQTLPAFIAGALFAFSPFRMDQISHLNLLATMLLPVYIILIMAAREAFAKESRRGWLYCALAGLILALTAYDTEHYAIFLIIFNVIFALFYLPYKKGDPGELRQWLRLVLGLSLALLTAAVIFLPVLIAAVREVRENGDVVRVAKMWLSVFSADALSFFTPDRGTGLIRGPFKEVASHFSSRESAYLGLVIILLASIGAWRYRMVREIRFWLLVTLIFLIFSLGPILRVYGGYSHLPMPYALINKLPLLNTIRVPTRYVAIATLTLAVLGGYGAMAIFERFRRFRHSRLIAVITTILIISALFLDVNPQTNLVSLEIPPVYETIAASNLPGSVVNLPLCWETGTYGKVGQPAEFTELYQSVHKRPLVGGVVSRGSKEMVAVIAEAPVLDYLSNPGAAPSEIDLDPQAIRDTMDKFQIAFIVVHKLYPKEIMGGELPRRSTVISVEEIQKIEQYVTMNLGMSKFEETEEVVAYRRNR